MQMGQRQRQSLVSLTACKAKLPFAFLPRGGTVHVFTTSVATAQLSDSQLYRPEGATAARIPNNQVGSNAFKAGTDNVVILCSTLVTL